MDGLGVAQTARARAVVAGTEVSPFASLDAQQIIRRIEGGASLRELASELGMSKSGLHAWLLRSEDPAYHEAVTAALAVRIAEADERLDTAGDPVDIARAREQARFSRMDFERRRPALYGQRPTTAIQVNPGDGGVQLVVYGGQESVASTQQPVDNSAMQQLRNKTGSQP